MPKKDYDKILTRLVDTLTKISDGEGPTTKDLAEEFGVGVRTIQKDVYQRLAQFSIESNEEGRLFFTEGFSLNKIQLEKDELILMNLALAQFEEVKNFNVIHDRIEKKLFNRHVLNPYFIKSEDLEDLDSYNSVVLSLEKSIANQKCIYFTYMQKEFFVESYKLANYDGLWYLFARDKDDNTIKTFQLRKIDNCKLSARYHTIKKEDIESLIGSTHSAYFRDGVEYEVKVLVDKEISHYFKAKEYLSSQKIEEEFDDGSILVSFEISHDEDVDNIIKSFLPHIKVLSPKSFKDRIYFELSNYLNTY